MASLNDPLLKYKIGIELIPGIGSILAKKLIDFAGSPEEIFKNGKTLPGNIPGIGKKLSESFDKQKILACAEREIEFISKYRIRALYYLDDDYPDRLKQCPDSPVILFVKGNACIDNPRALGIVGTRDASSYGLGFCRHLVSELAAGGHNPLIISGLAYGIDICAHNAALEYGLETLAILAHGLATMYPRQHRAIAGKIVNQGALVTDFISIISPERGNFIRRNRIIAGLPEAVVVVESSKKGGALLTADLANSYNRDVFALPGRVSDKRSQGCNNLIKTNKAALIEGVKDIEYILGWPDSDKPTGKDIPVMVGELDKEERAILMLLTNGRELQVDQISAGTGFSASQTAVLLLNLEFRGLVVNLPGKLYRLSEVYNQIAEKILF